MLERRRTAGSGPAAALPTLFGVSLSQHCPSRRRDPTWGPWPSSERSTGPVMPRSMCLPPPSRKRGGPRQGSRTGRSEAQIEPPGRPPALHRFYSTIGPERHTPGATCRASRGQRWAGTESSLTASPGLQLSTRSWQALTTACATPHVCPTSAGLLSPWMTSAPTKNLKG
jgi:hypothetical protein